jgi:predicted nucleotidyltransferase
MKAVQKKLDEMVRRIARRFHPQAVVLFGSHARGTANADSDVDLLVVMPANGSRRKQTVEIYGLLAGMGQPKDVIIVTPEEVKKFRNVAGTIVRMALREGKVLYGRLA